MAIIGYLFSAAELKALPRKHHATLLKGYLDENSAPRTTD